MCLRMHACWNGVMLNAAIKVAMTAAMKDDGRDERQRAMKEKEERQGGEKGRNDREEREAFSRGPSRSGST